LIIDNNEVKLADKIKELLPDSESVKIASGYFYVDGFNLVRSDLPPEIPDGFLQIIMGRDTTHLTSEEIGSGYRARRVPDARDEVLEKLAESLDRAYPESARTLYKMIKGGKADVYVYTEGRLHAKAYIFITDNSALADSRSVKGCGTAIVGSSNFTAAGIAGNRELNLNTSQPEDLRALDQWFESLKGGSEEFNEDLVRVIEASGVLAGKMSVFGRRVSPLELFMIFAREALDQQTSIRDRGDVLTVFQEIGVISAEQKIKRYGGVLIADSVGLGKSYIGAQILHNYFHGTGTAGDYWDGELVDAWRERGRRALLILPPNLIGQWKDEYLKDVFGGYLFDQVQGDFYGDRFRIVHENDEGTVFSIGEIELLSYNMFTRLNSGSPSDRRRLLDYADGFDIILIDEAQGFRDEDSKAWRNVQFLQNKEQKKADRDERIRNKFVLISATPLNNRISDLFNIFRIFLDKEYVQLKNWGVDSAAFKRYEEDRDVYHNLLAQLRRGAEPDEHDRRELERAKAKLKESSDRIREVLGELMVLRTRKYIQKEYGTGIKIAGKPLVFRDPHVQKVDYSASVSPAYQRLYDMVVEKIGELTLRYIEVFRGASESTEAMKGLLSTLLLKRLESSIYALDRTVDNMTEREKLVKTVLSTGKATEEQMRRWKTLRDKYLDEGDQIEFDKVDINGILEDIDNDLRIFSEIKLSIASVIESMTRVPRESPPCRDFAPECLFPDYADPKLKTLKEMLPELLKDDARVIVFTQYKDTAEYVFHKLLADPGFASVKMNIVTGGMDPAMKRRRAAAFIPNEKDDGTRLIISTDALSEGVNLQRGSVVINYDLPWNPMRIVQRVGRVNRIGSERDITVLNFFPDTELQARIRLISVLNRKISDVSYILVKEIQILSEDEEFNPEEAARRIFQKVSDGKPSDIEGEGMRGEIGAQVYGEEDLTRDKIVILNKIKELNLKDDDFEQLPEHKGAVYAICDHDMIKMFEITDGRRGVKIKNILVRFNGEEIGEAKMRDIVSLPEARELKGFDPELYKKIERLDKKADEIFRTMKARFASTIMVPEMPETQKAVVTVLKWIVDQPLAKFGAGEAYDPEVVRRADILLDILKKITLSTQEIGHLKDYGANKRIKDIGKMPSSPEKMLDYLDALEFFVEDVIKAKPGRTDETLRRDADLALKNIGWCDRI
jgi:SNF2 family DNA or RNA helicase